MSKQGLFNFKKKTWKIISYISIVFFLLVLFFIINIVSSYFSEKTIVQYPDNKSVEVQEDCNDCTRRSLDGEYVESDNANLFPFAVIIDNHPDARPSYGLSKANLVIEAEAEGGITRYFAVFAGDQDIEKIGPVRSIRSYFVDWAEEFSALLVHCGGSPKALVRIIKEDVYDLNEFYNEKLFWRDDNISAPHNIFTSSELLRDYLSAKKLLGGKYLSWKFFDNFSDIEVVYPEINIDYYSSVLEDDFVVSWKYDTMNSNYIRHLGGSIHKDGNEDEVRVSNIIIQYVEKKVVDEKLRLSLQTIGSGKAVVCYLGNCQKVTWKKVSKTSRTRFYDTVDNEIKFATGNIWIEVVDESIEVNY